MIYIKDLCPICHREEAIIWACTSCWDLLMMDCVGSAGNTISLNMDRERELKNPKFRNYTPNLFLIYKAKIIK